MYKFRVLPCPWMEQIFSTYMSVQTLNTACKSVGRLLCLDGFHSHLSAEVPVGDRMGPGLTEQLTSETVPGQHLPQEPSQLKLHNHIAICVL